MFDLVEERTVPKILTQSVMKMVKPIKSAPGRSTVKSTRKALVFIRFWNLVIFVERQHVACSGIDHHNNKLHENLHCEIDLPFAMVAKCCKVPASDRVDPIPVPREHGQDTVDHSDC
jgi:hypothetical protein